MWTLMQNAAPEEKNMEKMPDWLTAVESVAFIYLHLTVSKLHVTPHSATSEINLL